MNLSGRPEGGKRVPREGASQPEKITYVLSLAGRRFNGVAEQAKGLPPVLHQIASDAVGALYNKYQLLRANLQIMHRLVVERMSTDAAEVLAKRGEGPEHIEWIIEAIDDMVKRATKSAFSATTASA